MKSEGKTSKAPLTESFGRWANLKIVLLALFGAHRRPGRRLVHGPVLRAVLPDADAQGRRRRRRTCSSRSRSSLGDAVLHRVRLALGPDRPQADHHGGCLLAALTYFPIFKALTHYANPALARRRPASPGGRHGRPGRLLVPVRPDRQAEVHQLLRRREGRARQDGRPVQQRSGAGGHGGVGAGRRRRSSRASPATELPAAEFKAKAAEFDKALGAALTAAGYPAKADPSQVNKPMVVLLLLDPRDLRDDGLRADRGVAGRAVPDPHPLHVDVAAVPHRQRLVRRLPARRSRSRWSPRRATSTSASGTRSSSR